MHLNNAIGTRTPYISNHHEQACAIAAEGYARSCGKLAVVNVTTGPGGLNCLNCVFGQWTDSVPVLYISGQVKFVTTLASCPEIPLRQLGDPRQIRARVARRSDERAKRAYKIVVDIDPAELQKPLVKPDLPICADLKDFFPALAERLGAFKADKKWLDYSKNLRAKYAFENVPEYRQEKGVPVNVYNLTHTLTAVADPEDIFVVANGSPCICTCQCAVTKKGQRMFLNSGDASMGYDLPAAIGAAVANPDKKIICYTGDGSIMMNIQELQTIKTHNLPIRIFIIRNDGYSSIKQTHKNFFNANYVGCNAASGVETPDFCKVANAFGIDAERIENADNLEEKIRTILKKRGPYVCEIVCQNDYMFSPKLSAKQLPDGTIVSPSLEDMYPFLDRKEFESNMIK